MFKKRFLAVDIGNKNIKMVHGGVNKKKIVINEYDITDTPANAVKDGKIINLNALSKTVSESLKKYKIREKNLILNITGTGVITRDIQIPKSTDEEIEKMLEFEAQQYFPVDLENYVMDFKTIEDVDSVDGAFTRVLIVAVPKKQVEEYMKLPGLLKMDIAAIDLPVNCVSKLLFGVSDEDRNGTVEAGLTKEFAVIDIGAETTGVSIFSGGKLRFSRILLNGSTDIDKMISCNYNIDFKEAERRKIEKAVIAVEDIVTDSEAPEAASLSEAIKPAVDSIINDINRFFDFYNSRGAGNRIEKIYLCGGGSKLKGLDNYFNTFFNLPVECLGLVNKVEYKGKRKQEDFINSFPFLINAIGALVR